MTEPTPDNDGLSRLKSIRASRTSAAPRGKTRSRPPTKSTSKPAAKASYGTQAAATLKGVGGILGMRWPVHGAILTTQADTFGRELDELAAADKHVAELLDKVFNSVPGKTGAYVKFALAVAPMGAALAVASGVEHPVAAAIAAPVIQPAVLDVATRMAVAEIEHLAAEQGQTVDWSTGGPDPDRVAEIAAQLLAPPRRPEEAAE